MEQLTPLQQLSKIEEELHLMYDSETPPSEEAIDDFIQQRKMPINDGGLTIGIISLIITAWAAYRQERINRQKRGFSISYTPPPNCPVTTCGSTAKMFDYNTKEYQCENGHTWK